MANIIETLKAEINKNGTVDWKIVLFLLSQPVGLFAAYFMISRGYHAIEKPETFVMSTFYTVLFTLVAFILRILYQMGKPTAFLFVIINTLVWAFCLYIWVRAYLANQVYIHTKNKK